MVVLLTAFQVSPLMCSCAAPGSSHPGSAPECLLAGLEAKRAGLRMRLPKGREEAGKQAASLEAWQRAGKPTCQREGRCEHLVGVLCGLGQRERARLDAKGGRFLAIFFWHCNESFEMGGKTYICEGLGLA